MYSCTTVTANQHRSRFSKTRQIFAGHYGSLSLIKVIPKNVFISLRLVAVAFLPASRKRHSLKINLNPKILFENMLEHVRTGGAGLDTV